MDSDVIRAFHGAINSLLEQRPPVTKPKIVEITKAALNSVRYFKHVVLIAEKFVSKCRADYKLSGLYVVDSIVRQAKKQYQYKDVFAPRFAVNLQQTIANVLGCDAGERLKVVRVINLWKANGIFDEGILEPILQQCKAMGLEIDVYRVERAVKGDKANMQLYGLPQEQARPGDQSQSQKPTSSSSKKSRVAKSPSPPPSTKLISSTDAKDNNGSQQIIANTDLIQLIQQRDPQLGALLGLSNNSQMLKMVHQMVSERVTERLEIEKRREGNLKNLLEREFDYSDEEEDEDLRGGGKSAPMVGRDRLISLTREVLAQMNLSQELQHQMNLKQQQQQAALAGALAHQLGQQPALIGMPAIMNFSVPPPGIPLQQQQGPPASNPFSPARPPPPSLLSLVPQGVPPGAEKDQDHRRASGGGGARVAVRQSSPPRRESRDRGDRDGYSDRNRQTRKREHSRDRDREGRDRSRRGGDRSPPDDARARKSERRSSPPANVGRDREREKERDRDSEKDRERLERERERRKNGFPSRPKDDHILIATRTLWFGRLPSNCTEQDLAEAVKEAGVPEKILLIGSRGCAYVTMPDRRTAYKIMDRLAKDLLVQRKQPKIDWATNNGIKDNQRLLDYWDSKAGYAQIPFSKLPSSSLDSLLEGAWIDVATLPGHLKGRYNCRGEIIQLQQQTGLAMSTLPGAMGGAGGQMMPPGMTGLTQPSVASAINPAFLAAASLAAFGAMAPPDTTPPPGMMGAGPGAGMYGPPHTMAMAPIGMGVGGGLGMGNPTQQRPFQMSVPPPRQSSFRGFRIQGPPPRGGGGQHGGSGGDFGGVGGGFSQSFGNGSFGDESTSMFGSSAGSVARGRGGGGSFQPYRGRGGGGGGQFWRGGGGRGGGGFRGGRGDFDGGEMGFFNPTQQPPRQMPPQSGPPPSGGGASTTHMGSLLGEYKPPSSGIDEDMPATGGPQPLFSRAIDPPRFQQPPFQQHPEDPKTIRDRSPFAPNETETPMQQQLTPTPAASEHPSQQPPVEVKSVGELLAQTDAEFGSYSPDSSDGTPAIGAAQTQGGDRSGKDDES